MRAGSVAAKLHWVRERGPVPYPLMLGFWILQAAHRVCFGKNCENLACTDFGCGAPSASVYVQVVCCVQCLLLAGLYLSNLQIWCCRPEFGGAAWGCLAMPVG